MNTYSSLSQQERLVIRSQLHSSFPIIQAVIEGVQQGQIFRNASQDYWVLHKAGFSEVFLKSDDGKGLVDFITENNNLPKYFHIYNPPEKGVNVFKSKLSIFNIRERDRIQLQYEAKLKESNLFLDDEYTLTEVTRDNVKSLSVFNLDLANRFWNDEEEFINEALSVLIKDTSNNPVTLCYAAAVVDNKAEIDVVTTEHHRGKGLAKFAVNYFISKCLTNNINPNWDCFRDNSHSLNTALKLGFVENKLYNFISVYRK